MPWYSLRKENIDRLNVERMYMTQNLYTIAINQDIELNTYPLLNSVSWPEKEDILNIKFRQCSKVFNFLDQTSDLEEKDIKTEILIELNQFFSNSEIFLDEFTCEELMKMISANIFRVIPPNGSENYNPDEDEPVLEASWTHLQLIYDLFYKFLYTPIINSENVLNIISIEFMSQFLDLFDSPDKRERDKLKIILHRIYSKIISLRFFIRRKMGDIFLKFIYETERFNGIHDLLEVLNTIINGFKVPLKEEHVNFLFKILLPLLKPKPLPLYFNPLLYCILILMVKDSNLTEPIVTSILRYWPKTNSRKEVIFLEMIEKIFQIIEINIFFKVQVRIIKQICRSMNSSHYIVAEKSLKLFLNKKILNLIKISNRDLLPIIVPVVYKISKEHWNLNVIVYSQNVLKEFRRINSALVHKYSQ